ncbi:MAG: hypothetical protein ACRDIV_02235 [Ktedonobacteraceae bacterium]
MARPRILLLVGLLLVIVAAGSAFAFLDGMKTRQENNMNSSKATGTARTASTAVYLATATALARATADAQKALANPYPPYGGTVALDDSLRDNSKGYRWEVGNDDDGICQFSNAAYVVDTAKTAYVQYCKAATSPGHFTSFVYQARMTILKGDRGGLTFLVNEAQKTFYYFGIGQDGSYILDSFNGENATILLKGDASAFVHTGLNASNLVAVVLTGNNVDLYVNMHWIVRDSNIVASPNCLVGLAAQDRSNHTEVVFNDAMVWAWQ